MQYSDKSIYHVHTQFCILTKDQSSVLVIPPISYKPHIPRVHMEYGMQLQLMEMRCATYKLVCVSMLYITYML